MASHADLAQELLSLARDDAEAASAMLSNDAVTDAILGFHCQQAVEKSMKAALASLGVSFPFTHDLRGLIELCEENGMHLPAGLRDVDRLTPYGARFRYGGPDPETVDRATAAKWATEAVHWATARIGI